MSSSDATSADIKCYADAYLLAQPPQQRYRALRQLLGATQTEWARKFGISQQLVSAIEKGLQIPNSEHLMRIALTYGVEIEHLGFVLAMGPVKVVRLVGLGSTLPGAITISGDEEEG